MATSASGIMQENDITMVGSQPDPSMVAEQGNASTAQYTATIENVNAAIMNLKNEVQAYIEENNIKFIGASSKLIEMMGDKIQAKKIAKENGLPVIEGSEGGVRDVKEAKELC